MKIGVAQISCVVGDVGANVRKVREFVERAKADGVQLIVFPEMTDTGYSMTAACEHAMSWQEGAVPELQKIARNFSMPIVCGVSERDGSAIFNSQIVIDEQGEIVARYRKVHLFAAASIDERQSFTAGNAFVSFTLGQFRFGLSICYDLRFPEVYRALSLEQNANVFLLSSAWPFPRLEHFRTLAVARAIENQSYVVAANRVGTDDGLTFCGSSVILDPSGTVKAAASVDREELIQTEISSEIINRTRAQMTAFAHRRSDVYGRSD